MSAYSPASAAEAMDGIYRHQRFFYDATRRYYLFGRDEMLARLRPPAGGSVLEIGCGTARNLIHAARLYPSAHFYGLDISEAMLMTARQALSRGRLDRKIRLAHADATDFSLQELFNVPTVDRIFVSYALSMIPDWQRVVDRAASSLSPGGELHIVDFGTMEGLPSLGKRAMLGWLKRFQVTPRADLATVVHEIARMHAMSTTIHQGRLAYAAHAIIRN